MTGSASGMGRATRARLEGDGQRVIGVDRHDAEVVVDLGTATGRRDALEEVAARCDGSLDGVVTWAGLAGLTGRAGADLVSVNYFGTVELLDGLRPLLAAGTRPAAVAVSSNSTTVQPGVPLDVVQLCLDGDEERACAAADAAGPFATYPATKIAVAWWARAQAPRRRWAGAGITLNVVAPGAVETPMLQSTREDPTIGAFVDAFPVPVGRTGTGDELAGVVQFLLGPDARFFCGSVIFVDGGTDALVRPDRTPSPLPAD